MARGFSTGFPSRQGHSYLDRLQLVSLLLIQTRKDSVMHHVNKEEKVENQVSLTD